MPRDLPSQTGRRDWTPEITAILEVRKGGGLNRASLDGLLGLLPSRHRTPVKARAYLRRAVDALSERDRAVLAMMWALDLGDMPWTAPSKPLTTRRREFLAAYPGNFDSLRTHDERRAARALAERLAERGADTTGMSYRVRAIDRTMRLGPRVEIIEWMRVEALTETAVVSGGDRYGRSMTAADFEVEVLEGARLGSVLPAAEGLFLFTFVFASPLPPGTLAYLRIRQAFDLELMDDPGTAVSMDVPADELAMRLQVLPGVDLLRTWRRDGAPEAEAPKDDGYDVDIELDNLGFTEQLFTDMEPGKYYGIGWELAP
jgi:hypothetical protein